MTTIAYPPTPAEAAGSAHDQLAIRAIEATEDQTPDGASAAHAHDIAIQMGFNVIWLDRDFRKMGVGVMGIDRTGIISHVTERLRSNGLNIDGGFSSLIEVAAGAFFEISGDPAKMRAMFDEIVQARHQQSPLQHAPPTLRGTIYELKVIAPDRPGIVNDITQRLIQQRISIDQMVIRTKKSRTPKGIVYGRLETPSAEAHAKFIDSLRSVDGYKDWKIKYEKWAPMHRPSSDFAVGISGMMN